MNIWGPSPHTPPRGKATGGGWGTIYALPVAKGLSYTPPVHVVEEAPTKSARANYFESSPRQAAHWRKAAPSWTRPCDFDAWLAKGGLEGGADLNEKQPPQPDAEIEANQHDPVVAGE
eukprot:6011704-Pyramimonas_sp.AAC.1